jgi:hypothetical protein
MLDGGSAVQHPLSLDPHKGSAPSGMHQYTILVQESTLKRTAVLHRETRHRL